jgi:predicted glycosyltransferase
MNRRLRIWIDLANTPHVLFFEPIIRELEKRGHSVLVTARSFANTLALVRARGLRARQIGAGHDTSRSDLLKHVYHFTRTAQLMAFARGRFDVAASPLSYTQASAARRLGIPTFGTIDYEYKDLGVFRHTRCLMVPAVIPPMAFEKWGISARFIRPYDGLKEHVYLAGFRPAVDVRERLGIAPHELLVSFRPIAEHGQYGDGNGHRATLDDSRGDVVQRRLLESLASQRNVRVLVLPRTERQRRVFESFARRRPSVLLAREAFDGPSLIFASDMVVTGGGTMLREAAVLGVPAISCFAGPLGAVDSWLASEGKVILVRSAGDAERLRVEKRASAVPPPVDNAVLMQVVQGICDTAERE